MPVSDENALYLLRLAGVALTIVVCVRFRPWRWLSVWWRSRG